MFCCREHFRFWIIKVAQKISFKKRLFHSATAHLKEGFDDPPPHRAHHRVVVTGLGLVTPLGCGVEHNWNEIQARKTGIRTVEKVIHPRTRQTSIGGIKVVANVPRKRSIKEDSENGNDKDAGENMFDDSKWHDDANRSPLLSRLAGRGVSSLTRCEYHR